jgi:hypothetical protein
MTRINEIWWTCVLGDVAMWHYIELRRRDVIERLGADVPNWKKEGWRIVKLRVTEIPMKKGLI